MLHAVTTGAYYPPVGTPLEDFDYQSILVDSGSIVHWTRLSLIVYCIVERNDVMFFF